MDLKEVVSAYYSIYEGKKKEDEKPKKWFDDDGDGEGYEEGEVDGKFDKKKKKKKDEEEVDEGLEFVDDLTEEELDALVEETVEAYLEEGYDIDELDQIFVEYLEEAKVTYGHDSDGDDKGDDLVSAVKKRKDEKAAKAQKRVEKVKNAIKKQVGRVKQAASDFKSGETEKKVKAWAMEPATRRAAEKSKANPTGKGLMPFPKKKNEKGELKPQTYGKEAGPEKEGLRKTYDYATLRSRQLSKSKPETAKKARREVRKAIVGDLKNRARVGAYNLKRNVKADAKLKTDKAKSTIKGFVKKATSAPKRAAKAVSSAASGAVKKVRNKTAGALSALADKIKTEGIELDAFDTVTAYLIDEGFATTFDEAQKIMTTLDSELIKEVHEHQLNEAMLLTRADKVGNTPAWQNRDKKNVKTGEPIYKKADHLKKEDK